MRNLHPLARILIALPLALLASHSPARAQCTLSETKTDIEQSVTLENSYVRLTVDLLHGGKVTSFLYKPLDRQWLVSGEGMFIDHVWQQVWPGELYSAKYEYQIVARGPERVAVKVWRVLGDNNPTVGGVKVERTLSLTADSPAVVAEVSLSNPTQQDKAVGYWAQNIFKLSGENDNYFLRPFTGGLSVATARVQGEAREVVGQDFVKDPTAGWTATLNAVTGEGAVFLMDYNDLRWLYNCIGNYTTEWYYDLLRMAPGRVWNTRYELLPVSGYHGVSYASHRLVADVRTVRGVNGDRLVYTLGCGERPLAEVTLTASLGAGAGAQHETLAVGAVGFRPAEMVSSLAPPAGQTPFQVQVTLKSGTETESFTRYFNAQDRTNQLTAGIFKSAYSVPPPAKVKLIEQPANLQRVAHQGTAVLEVRGQFYPSWRLEEALQGLGEHRLRASNYTSNVYGDQLDYFPPSLQDALALDAVVLNNVPVDALDPQSAALLREYVKNGGGLLVLGGWYAFGGGHYAGSVLEEMLPVASGAPFDIHWYAQGLPLKAVAGATALADLHPAAGMQAVWMQEPGAVKPGGQVLLTAGDKPFLVTGTYGKGRVACVLGTTAGVAPAGGELFSDAPEWPQMLGRIIGWLKDGK